MSGRRPRGLAAAELALAHAAVERQQAAAGGDRVEEPDEAHDLRALVGRQVARVRLGLLEDARQLAAIADVEAAPVVASDHGGLQRQQPRHLHGDLGHRSSSYPAIQRSNSNRAIAIRGGTSSRSESGPSIQATSSRAEAVTSSRANQRTSSSSSS